MSMSMFSVPQYRETEVEQPLSETTRIVYRIQQGLPAHVEITQEGDQTIITVSNALPG